MEADWKHTEAEIPVIGILFETLTITSNLLNAYG